MRPMRTVALLLVTTLAAGPAPAQGIVLFGDARLGLGHNIDNAGGVTGDEDLRAVSRVRFGVSMTGTTDAGITFGATIRADNSRFGEGGELGQEAGNVFVSGVFGTLTFGDTNGADEQWVGDVPGNLSLTGLGDLHETPFLSNGGNFNNESGNSFAANPLARPTIRYDFDIGGFGVSLSANRDLDDFQVGAGYATEFRGASIGIGIGYNDYSRFSVFNPEVLELQVTDANGDPVSVEIPGDDIETVVPAGEQWSAGLNLELDAWDFGLAYTNASAFSAGVEGAFETLAVGGTFAHDAWTLGAFYQTFLTATGGPELAASDGLDSYGLTAAYDLGGGATVATGLVKTFGVETGDDGEAVADFGIRMSF